MLNSVELYLQRLERIFQKEMYGKESVRWVNGTIDELESWGYGYVEDTANQVAVAIIICLNESYTQESIDSYAKVVKNGVYVQKVYTHFLFKQKKNTKGIKAVGKFSYLDELEASKSKNLLSLEENNQIRFSSELVKKLYYEALPERPIPVMENLQISYNKWKEERINLQLFHIRKAHENAQLGEWNEWVEHFEHTKWSNVFMLFDEELHTGTLILHRDDIKADDSEIVEELAKNLSWSLLTVHQNLLRKGHVSRCQHKIHSINYLLVGEIKDLKEYDRTRQIGRIVNGLAQKGELLHEAKITFLLDTNFDLQPEDWEVHYLANHLIPLRRKSFTLDSLQGQLEEKLNEYRKRLKTIEEKVQADLSINTSQFLEDKSTQLLERIRKFSKPIVKRSESSLEKVGSIFVGIKAFSGRPFIIELEKKMNLIFAPNGYGKSTLMDGLKNTVTESDTNNTFAPLWNITDGSKGIFAMTNSNNEEHKSYIRQISQKPEDKVLVKKLFMRNDVGNNNGTYVDEKDSSKILNMDPLLFNCFCYTNEFSKDMLADLFLKMLSGFTTADLSKISLSEMELLTSNDRNVRVNQNISEFNVIVQELEDEISKFIEKNILPLLMTLTTVMTSDAWLYKLRYRFEINEGLRIENENQEHKQMQQNYDLENVLNLGEQRIVNLAIFFLLYYLEGINISKMILLDDIFDAFDQRQCYNILRFITTFSNMENIKDVQWIVLSHWKAILDYFYYGILQYMENNQVKYYDFVFQEEISEEETLKISPNYLEYARELDSESYVYKIPSV